MKRREFFYEFDGCEMALTEKSLKMNLGVQYEGFSVSSKFTIGGEQVEIGQTKTIELHLGRLYDFTELTLPIEVIRGKSPGPTMFVSGSIHGDELIGAAIVKSVLSSKKLKGLKGTLIAIPIVNVFGFNTRSRYLPDRRDLNRCFPGNARGSLGSRVAHLFMKEIVKKSDLGIDFHSGALHRSNLPQIRTSFLSKKDKSLAEIFGVPVVLDSKLREGSLRQSAAKHDIPVLVFEGGEALRISEQTIKFGVNGAFNIMENMGMLPTSPKKKSIQTYMATSSYWVRAPQAGMVRLSKTLGGKVKNGSLLGKVTDAFGRNAVKVVAPSEGVIIGMSNLPLVNKGDALFHIATFEDSDVVRELAAELNDYSDLFYQ